MLSWSLGNDSHIHGCMHPEVLRSEMDQHSPREFLRPTVTGDRSPSHLNHVPLQGVPRGPVHLAVPP